MTPDPVPPTEHRDPRTEALDEWPVLVAAHALWEGQLAAIAAIRPALPAIAEAAEQAASRLGTAGRLIYCGAGTSGRLGVLDASELAPTFDWPEDRVHALIAGGAEALTRAVENAEDRAEEATRDAAAADISAADVVIALAASGATPYAVACAAASRARGALTIGIANVPGAPLLAACAHGVLIETGAEPIAGSTRLKAGTAQKVVLNLLSTLIMIRLGRVWRGQMVDVVARNAKLRRRALRMVMQGAGCDAEAAQAALDASGGKAKLAILVARGMAVEEARARLARSGGHLRAALG